MKRDKQLIIRVSLAEYRALIERKTKPRLAAWMRETCLGVKSVKSPLRVEPALLINLAKIGGNLNQIAKYINQNRKNRDDIHDGVKGVQLIDHIKIVNELILIRDNLDILLEWHINAEQSHVSEDI